MATWEDVRRIALSLPEATERSANEWQVKDKSFVWERSLRPADRAALGKQAPVGSVLGAHVGDLGVKDALLADSPDIYFTTPHFDGYRAILIRLQRISKDELQEIVIEAWLARAPKRLAKLYLDAVDADTPGLEQQAAKRV